MHARQPELRLQDHGRRHGHGPSGPLRAIAATHVDHRRLASARLDRRPRRLLAVVSERDHRDRNGAGALLPDSAGAVPAGIPGRSALHADGCGALRGILARRSLRAG